MKTRLDYGFCEKCEAKIKHRIKLLKSMEKDRDRDFVIQQLEFLLEN